MKTNTAKKDITFTNQSPRDQLTLISGGYTPYQPTLIDGVIYLSGIAITFISVCMMFFIWGN